MSNEFTWTCSRCGRAVPRRVDACRCGYTRAASHASGGAAPAPPGAPAVSPPPVAAAGSTVPPPARAAGNQHVVLIAASVIGVAVIVAAVVLSLSWMKSAPGSPSSSATAVVAAAPAPGAALSMPADLGEPPPVLTMMDLLAPPGGDTPNPMTIEDVVTRALPAVVKVETRDGLGSGFFVTPDRLLTNAHVVGQDTSVTVRLSGGQKKSASVDEVWREVDLAILKLDIVDLDQVILPIAAPADVRVGAEVVAIGSPLGLQNTVTRGIISGMRMYIYDRITPQGMEVVQTDAAINPGNSGGPLIDRYGRVVGVNTLKRGGGAEGLGFAVQMHYARRMLGPEFALTSATEQRLSNGLRTYETMVGGLARRADDVEVSWGKFRRQCFASVAEQPPPREWFVLWDGSTSSLSDTPACGPWRQYFLGWAKLTHDALDEYNQNAREAGVAPATLRTIRRKYNMAWPAWER